jgi:hypothetical protein
MIRFFKQAGTNSAVCVWVLVSVLALAVGCGGDAPPADVNGTYALSVTNGPNECMDANWTAGQTSVGQVNLVLTQQADPTRVSGEVVGSGGFVELIFRLAYGSNNFAGTVNGNALNMDLVTSGRTEMTGACTHTRTARAVATLEKDTITGTLYHYFRTNGVPDCGYRSSCNNSQMFNGTRPPKQ